MNAECGNWVSNPSRVTNGAQRMLNLFDFCNVSSKSSLFLMQSNRYVCGRL